MPVTLKDVDYVAALSHLRFTDKEREQLVDQMNTILTYMEQLNTLDTSEVPPTTHVLNLKNIFREDIVEKSLSQEEALQNAPSSDKGHFTVPKVL
ncbi:MAG: Asp-tRNA(Asn)/Glu-tRNA(Gln) amidotransferase subunit GatC [Candidatus Latescibacteria bacterium]|jgi:aspartyl-tRNA(Asn)/glutamyl-tRNA(Gln) amidotransferase subunit C|nr:Asp-tRNA(Asn)/Glu-tRNA(Gln) amidotransferase subunit GatC [Candidatus Latescibacterota bacterium]MDP7235222.1 Asp-tRNA(Asn)/Glu-tRNA(Gln) amidotransferase subunit GatC [Candidatus Latescibacterota bacterium]MEE2991705.1 Asp-tRNA(Asn)/Glu-tRNA(Gln) amidotransferase subunit GatC [Gemmatimonadota bacterium]|tara:strand:+ start:461 stop:745 length:285 start_codon:yes stop_codon:yes gene_type:complete